MIAVACGAGCEYGDQVPWCSTYVQGAAECARPEVAEYCCKTCVPYLNPPKNAPSPGELVQGLCHNMFRIRILHILLRVEFIYIVT